MENNTIKTNYGAEQIKVLSGLEGVRMRPAMYIGNTAEEGLHHLVYEVVDNSIDEALAGHCSHIKVIIHKEGSVSVEDDGRGIPVGIHPTEGVSALELVMCTLHAGGKFDHSTYKVSGGLHGVGVSVVNALSLKTVAEVRRDGHVHRQSYCYGIKESEVEIVGPSDRTGTRITFLPDPGIFTETTEFNYEIIQTRLRELAFLNKDVKIILHDERSGAEDEFHFKGGIVSFVEYLNRNRTVVHNEPVFVEGERDDVQVEVAFQYFDGYSERLFSYVNNIHTREGGAHVVGFRAALTKCINRYASDDIVPKNLREKLSGDDVREGITCVISTRVPNPQFEGQTKTKLGNSEVKSIVETVCHEKISEYLEQNPQEARKILGKAVEAARAREAARRAKDLSRKKGGLDVMMAAKLAECQSKDPKEREIFLVEGDSAGGSAKQGRDRSIQAILPLRGKIMNVEKARFDKILSSEEIKQLIAALGTGIGKEEFDPERLRYHKIIIMTDADVDGAHIRTLLLTFFYRQMLSLVENGHVYIGQPPLYRLSRGKKEQFFLDDDALNRFLFSQASTMMNIRTTNGRVVEGEELVGLLQELVAYQRVVDNLGRINLWEEMVRFLLAEDIHSADQFENQELLNQLHQKLGTDGRLILSSIRPCRWRPSCYEFDAAIKDKAHLIITIGPQIPLMPEYRAALAQYPAIKDYLDGGYTVVVKNQEIAAPSWREMLATVKAESFKGSSLQRYKGLGEMNPEQLWETTMNPGNRILLQVTIEDAEKADEMFTTLMGDKVEPRRDFIQNHALEVSSLDF